jgi:thymidylate synthase ThyX
MFATIDLHNLLKFFELRDHAHAQYEIQVYAQGMIEKHVPMTLRAFDELQSA